MKKALRILMLSLLGLAVLSTSVFAAGVDLTGIGARATALGGNYRAVANDWSAMFWNPAGLVFTQGLKAGVSTEFVTPSVGYTKAENSPSVIFSNEVKNVSKTFFLPSAGVYLSTGKVAFGVGFWAPFGLGAKWDLLNTSTYNKNYPQYDIEDDLKIIDIHPTLAYKVSDKLSIGVGASIILADIMIRKPTFTPNPYLSNYDYFKQSINGTPDAVLPPAQKEALIGAFTAIKSNFTGSPYDHMLTEGILDGDGTGFGFNVGLMFKPHETFSIGLSGKFYNDIKLDGTVKTATYFSKNENAQGVVNNLKGFYDGLKAAKLIDNQTYGVLNNYYSGVDTKAAAKPTEIKAELPLPKNIGIGFSYTGISKLLIAADVAWTQWSVWDVIDINEKESGEIYTNLTENWKDGVRFGLGMEYDLLPELKLRGSYYNEPSAAVPETMAPTIPDAGGRNVINLGIEVPIGPLRLHASAEKIFVKDLTVDKWILAADKKGYDNWAGLYTMSVFNFMAGIDYAF